MTLQLFLNDLSTADAPCHLEVAVSHLKQFVATLRATAAVSAQFVLNGDRPLSEMSFGPDWPLAALRNAAGCVDENIYLKTIQDRFPLSQTIADLRGPPAEEFEHEYRLCNDAPLKAGSPASSLGLAHQFDGLALSLPSHPFWQSLEIELDRLSLQFDGELVSEKVRARNACSHGCVVHHQGALKLALRPRARHGAELWAQRERLVPNLRFIPRTRQQIESLQHGDPVFDAVLNRLADLDRSIDQWRRQDLAHPVYPFNVRPESRRRLSLTAFNDADGVTRTFSDHADFAPGEGRIHFLLQAQPVRHALIGHVGRKLGIG